jgi:hypothetical protein
MTLETLKEKEKGEQGRETMSAPSFLASTLMTLETLKEKERDNDKMQVIISCLRLPF